MPIDHIPHPEASEFAPYYSTYVDRVPETNVLEALERQLDEVGPFLASIPEARAGHRYAEGKWSIRQVVGHLCDAERVFAYRALRFSRADATPLPGFDEDHFVAQGAFDHCTLAGLAEEFLALRRSNLRFFRGMDPGMLLRQGTANGNAMSVRAVAAVLVGHVRHHLGVLQERYL